MRKDGKIYVAGHSGLVGSAILRALKRNGFQNIVTRTHLELDLTEQNSVEEFFAQEKPDYVFLAAAKVGGILANALYPAEFIYQNLTIQTNVIHSAYRNYAEKLLFLGSGCIYPRVVPQPIKESYLMTAPLEKTNEAYAIAKIAGLMMCQAYNKQYGTDYISVMPCNLYGEGDNYNLQNSHVIPALLRKFHEAKTNGAKEVVVWGTGNAMREFMHVDDMADACLFLMDRYSGDESVNIGYGEDFSIRSIAELIAEIVNFKGRIVQDPSMPDGTPRKLLDSGKLFGMGWLTSIDLKEGLTRTYKDYLIHLDNYRK
jgi:GDP-L-fucose synthase